MSQSAISAKSLHQNMVRSKTVLTVFHTLHIMMEKVKPYPIFLTYAGMFICQMQYLFLAFSPAYQYNSIIAKQLALFVGVFAGPLFDRDYGPVPLTVYTAVLAIFFGLLLMGFILLIVALVFGHLLEHRSFLLALHVVLNIISGWMYIPLLNLFLGAMMCKDGQVLNFSESKCNTPMHLTNLILGSTGIVITFGISLIMCWEYDLNPLSTHPLARAHGYFDIVFLIFKTALIIFYNILVMSGNIGAYGVLCAISSLLLILIIINMLPYYHISTTSLMTGIFSAVMAVSIINSLYGFNVDGLGGTVYSAHCFLTLCVLPMAWLFGFCLGPFRVNSEFASKLGGLFYYGVTAEHVAQIPFPRTLRASEANVVSVNLRNLEKELIQEMSIEEGNAVKHPSSDSGEAAVKSSVQATSDNSDAYESIVNRRSVEFLIPYLHRVIFVTDTEVSTRFLHHYTTSTGEVVRHSAAQLAFALRLYFRGLVHFRQSGYVSVSLGWFLYIYCNRTGAVMELLRELENRRHVNLDYMVMFKAYRLEACAKEALGYRDAAHLFALQRARQHHRQAIATTERFWSSLNRKEDALTLILINSQLAQQRSAATSEYRLAVSTSQEDRTTLYSLSAFVEDLYNEKDVAQELRNTIDEIELQKKNNMMRGAARSNHSKHHVNFNEVLAATKMDRAAKNQNRSFEKILFMILIYGGIFIALVASAVLMALSIHNAKVSTRSALAMVNANMARAYGYSASYNSMLASIFYYENSCATSSTACSSDLDYIEMLQSVSSAEMNMRIQQNIATYGDHGPSLSSRAYNFLVNGMLLVRFNPQGKGMYDGTMCCKDGISVTLYAKLTSVLEGILIPMVQWIAVPHTSGYITTMVNRMQHTQPYMHYMQFVTDGDMDTVMDSLVSLCKATFADLNDLKISMLSGMIACLVIIIIALAVTVAAFYINVEWIAKNRIMMMGLFTSIPTIFVEQLREQTENRLVAFEVSTDVREDGEDLQLASQGDDEYSDDAEEPIAGMNRLRSSTRRSGDAMREANSSYVATLLQSKPQRSCFKVGATSSSSPRGPVAASIKSVHFRLTQRDLADRPRARLYEPKVHVSGKELIEEFEKNLVELDDEVSKEKQMCAQQLRDANTVRKINTSYRVQWSQIKERMAAWNTNTSLFKKLYHGVLIPVLLMLSAVTLTLVAIAFTATAETIINETNGIAGLSQLYEYVAQFYSFDFDVSSFCNFFYTDARDRVVEYAFVSSSYQSIVARMAKQYDTTILDVASEMNTLMSVTLRPVLSDIIYASLGARGGYALGSYDIIRSPYLSTFSYGQGDSDPVLLSNFYPSAFSDPEEYTIPMLEDMPDGAGQFYGEVLPLHRRDRFFVDSANIYNALSSSANHAFLICDGALESTMSTSRTLDIVSIIFSPLVTIGASAALYVARKRKLGRVLNITLFIGVIASVVSVALCVALYFEHARRGSLNWTHRGLDATGQFFNLFFNRMARLEQYFHYDRPNVILEIMAAAPMFIEKTLDVTLNGKTTLASIASVDDIVKADQNYWRIQQIAMLLAYCGHFKIQNPTGAPNDCLATSPVSNTWYNAATEETYESDVIRYGKDHPTLHYTNTFNDLQRPGNDLLDMARFTVFGLRGSDYFKEVCAAVDAATSSVAAASLVAVKKDNSIDRTLGIATITMLSVMVLCFLVATLLPAAKFIRGVAQGRNCETVSATVKVSYGSLLTKVNICGGVFVVLAVLQFALAVAPLGSGKQASDICHHSALRVAELTRSMALVTYGAHAVNAQSPDLASTAFASLASSVEQLEDSRQYLYFRDDAASNAYGKVPSLTDRQRQIMFTPFGGGRTTIDGLYTQFISILKDLLAFKPITELSPPNAPVNPKNTFVLSEDQVDWVNSHVKTLTNTYTDVIDGLEQSTALYESQVPSQLYATMVPAIVIFVVTLIVMSLAAIFIIPKYFNEVDKGEEETRLLLKAAPKVVHDAVPAIALFMDSSVIEDNTEETINATMLSPVCKRFLSVWKKQDPSEDGIQCCNMLNRVSNAVVVTDMYGTIIYANDLLLTLTGHEVLEGKSVGILMEATVAAVHSEFMKHYMRNRGPEGPRRTNVMLVTKEGESLHVINMISEAPTKNDQVYFLSELCPFAADEDTLHPQKNQKKNKKQ